MMRFKMSLFVLLFLAPLCSVPSWGAEAVGKIALLRGAVTIDGKPAKESAPVTMGQTIRTGLGKCAIFFRDQHIVHLDSDTQLKITQALVDNDSEKTELELSYGKTRMLIKNNPAKKRQFSVKTRAAVMGVRGTHLYLDVPRDPSLPERLMTVEGAADVQIGNRQIVLRQNEILETRAETRAKPSSGAQSQQPTPLTRTLSPRETTNLTQAIAPPPAPLRTGGDVLGMGAGTTAMDPNRILQMIGPQPLLPPPLPLDPLVDGGVGVKVRITLKPFASGV